MTIVAIGVALLLQAEGASAPDLHDPVAVVTEFLSLLDSNEQRTSAMLTTNAMAVAGDTGVSMTDPGFNPFFSNIMRGCRAVGLEPDGRTLNILGHAIVDIVGRYHCVTAERPSGRDMVIEYFVEGNRIAGVHMQSEAGHGR